MRVFVIVAAVWAAGMAWGQDAPGVISVTGEGRVTAVPDMAVVQVGVQEQARDASIALRAVSEGLEAVLADLAEAGVAASDVQTSSVSVSPVYDRRQAADPVLTGYVASSSLSVKVRDLDTLGGILDDVVGSGANQLNGLSLTLADPAPMRDDARRLAVADARAKAELYAEAAGVSLGRIVSLSDGSSPSPVPMQRFAMAEAAAMDVPIATGELDLVQGVAITFEIEQ